MKLAAPYTLFFDLISTSLSHQEIERDKKNIDIFVRVL